MPLRDKALPKNTLSYFFREASRRMWVSKRTSFVAIAMIAIALLIVGAFLLVAENLGRAVEQAEGKSRVNIYLDVDATPQQIAAVDGWLGAHRDFAGRRFVSKAIALARFRQYFANLSDVVGQLDENPFPASFECDIAPLVAQAPAFRHQAAELRAMTGVEQVQFDWEWVQTLKKLINLINIAGLVVAIATGHWYLKQIYREAYFPMVATIWLLGAFGQLPRVKASTKGEGHERRYFYGSVWAVCWAQPALWLLWKIVPRTAAGDTVKLVVFLAILTFVGNLARLGRLPRTRPIVPGEIAVSD